jgi:hypothetical protein
MLSPLTVHAAILERPLYDPKPASRAAELFGRSCEGLSDACRGGVAAALCLDRQASDKPQGRKPRAGSGSVVRRALSMGI